MLGGVVAMDLADLRAEGERLVVAARTESDRILREARAEAARLRAKAIEEGKVEGLALGRTEGLEAGRAEGTASAYDEVRANFAERLQGLESAWTVAAGRWDAERESLMREARQQTLQLALGIAKRVLRRAIAADPTLATTQLEAALQLLGQATSIAVACSQSDHDLLRQELPRVLERLGSASDVTFTTDPALEPGDIIVRVAEGSVDGRLTTQLDRIADALMPQVGPTTGTSDGLSAGGSLIP